MIYLVNSGNISPMVVETFKISELSSFMVFIVDIDEKILGINFADFWEQMGIVLLVEIDASMLLRTQRSTFCIHQLLYSKHVILHISHVFQVFVALLFQLFIKGRG